MSLQRVERALQQSGLEVIDTAGLPFDPETMEVLEVVHEPGRTSTEVIEEVRRGYLWRGYVFRFAQVRVARPQPS
jgi:molecular chaperone GrpE